MLLKAAYERMVRALAGAGVPLPANAAGFSGDKDLVKRYLDCAVVGFLHQLRAKKRLSPFNTVRAAFFEGQPLYPGAGFAAKTHIQWCVRNPRQSILGYFRPLPEPEEEPEAP